MSSNATCTACGCTDLCACVGGCSWLAVNRDDGTGVCSRCQEHLAAWRYQQAEPTARQRRDLLQQDLITPVDPQAQAGVRCHGDACAAGQLPCPTPLACGVDGGGVVFAHSQGDEA